MLQTEYTENLFRSIDTIIAERIKNLPYDTTQLAEITDITNCKQGMYKISADNQFEEIAYSDNPTYEVGDKVYVLTTSDKTRRFIIGIFQKCSSGRTDRVLSTLNNKIELLDNSLTDKYLELKDETGQFMAKLSITAKELRSEYLDLSQGLNTLISQTADEILLKAENKIEEKYASLSITADGISTKVGDAINELETRISQTANEIRLEAEDMKNGLEASLSITAEQIRSEVSDELSGVESNISQTASEIRSEVADHLLGIESSISQTANEIFSQIQTENNDKESSLIQRLDEIRLQVKDTQIGISEVSQQADNITSRVQDMEGNFSYIKQEADKITSRVQDVEGNYSEIQQTANAIRSRVEDVNNGLSSEIEQTADSITTKINAVDGKYSLTKSTVDGWSVTTQSGTTEINGAKIKTGTVTADKINAASFDVIHKDAQKKTVGRLGMYIGSASVSDAGGNIVSITPTYGAALYGKNEAYVITATEAGARMSDTKTKVWNNKVYSDPDVAIYVSGDSAVMYSHGNQVKVSNKGITSSDSVHTISDRRMKHTISYNLSSYENFYNELQPVSYIYNSDSKNKKHIGFIYQDIEASLLHSGLTSSDFAGVYKAHNDDGSVWCGLGYTEFIALNTHMIQKTRKELEEKNNKIQQLENKINELEQKLNLLLETLF